jgi:hypothetical protein
MREPFCEACLGNFQVCSSCTVDSLCYVLTTIDKDSNGSRRVTRDYYMQTDKGDVYLGPVGGTKDTEEH